MKRSFLFLWFALLLSASASSQKSESHGRLKVSDNGHSWLMKTGLRFFGWATQDGNYFTGWTGKKLSAI